MNFRLSSTKCDCRTSPPRKFAIVVHRQLKIAEQDIADRCTDPAVRVKTKSVRLVKFRRISSEERELDRSFVPVVVIERANRTSCCGRDIADCGASDAVLSKEFLGGIEQCCLRSAAPVLLTLTNPVQVRHPLASLHHIP